MPRGRCSMAVGSAHDPRRRAALRNSFSLWVPRFCSAHPTLLRVHDLTYAHARLGTSGPKICKSCAPSVTTRSFAGSGLRVRPLTRTNSGFAASRMRGFGRYGEAGIWNWAEAEVEAEVEVEYWLDGREDC